MDLSELNLDIRAFNAVCRAGFKTAEELFQAMGENQERVRLLVGRSNFDRIDEAFAELEDKGMLEFNTKLPPAPAEATTPEYLEAFNLNARIHYCKDSVERGLAEMCIGIEQMRSEKQYKQLGYQNFEDYCLNEFGFSDRQGRKYADVGKMLNNENRKLTSGFENLGMEKLHLLSKLDDPTLEVVAETVDVESVTVKELKAQITALTAERDENEHAAALLSEELDSAKESLASKDKQFQEAMESKNRDITRFCKEKTDANEKLRKKHAEWVRAQNENATLTGRIYDLEKQIKELENRPVEVAVSEDEAKEIERLKSELEDAKLRASQAEKFASSKAEQAAALVRSEYEEKLAKVQSPEPDPNDLKKSSFRSLKCIFEEIIDEIEETLKGMDDKPRMSMAKSIIDYAYDNLSYLTHPEEDQHDTSGS